MRGLTTAEPVLLGIQPQKNEECNKLHSPLLIYEILRKDIKRILKDK